MYHRRSQFDPLWNSYIVGGVQKDGTPYLGYTNMIGVGQLSLFVTSEHVVRPVLLIGCYHSFSIYRKLCGHRFWLAYSGSYSSEGD